MWGELRVSSFGRASLDRVSLEFLSVSYFGRASLDKASLKSFGDSKFFTDSVTVELITIGIQREHGDFVKQVANVGHLRVLPHAGTRDMNEPVPENLHWDTGGLISLRIEFFDKWLERAQDLAEEESKLHDGLCSLVRQVLRGKGLLLHNLLGELDYSGETFFEDVVSVFALAVWMSDSGVFLSLPRPPWVNLGALSKPTVELQHAILGKVVEPEGSEPHAAAWVNDACSLPERFLLHGIDCFAAELIRSGAVPSSMAFRPWRQSCYPTTLNLKKRVNVGLPLELAPDVRSCEPDPSDRTFGCLPYSLFWGGPHLARCEVSHIDNETSCLALTEAYSSTELG